MKKLLGLWGLAVLVLMTMNPARAVSLADLIANQGSITVGDKIFDNWTLLGDGLVDTVGYSLNDIDVTGIDDGGDYGLLFASSGGLSVTGDNFLDLFFGYRVSVLPGSGMAIKDVSFSFNSGGWSGDGFTGGIEDVYSLGGQLLGSIELEASSFAFDIDGSSVFAPQSSVLVAKNLLLYGFSDGDSTYLNSFSQRFSQVAVPEPGSLALLGLGLLGLSLGGRRRS